MNLAASRRRFSIAFAGERPMRLEAARFMLEVSVRNTREEIARETGFGDRERMRRSFLRTFGESPRALRNAAHPLATI